ncbi:5-formyltetrahydrofolate cyclo-ligase [Arthrobacter sp. JZ12]|uniref:5-formyltetrahydrofolate cyclo-ligase n=1 Tax=Arthrobacter sp. JZ12 TaxID=2654190 RepID=UPI002B462891|nr:5-formyltetrahydrofolate cyclo-ligase [Arthrobacter sp. JZ12]
MDVRAGSATKEELRRSLRLRREGRSGSEQEAAGTALAEHVLRWLAGTASTPQGRSGPPVVAAYLSAPTEPSTAALLPALREAGYDVVVPVCEPQYQLSWARWEPRIPLAKSPRAPLWEPVGERFHFTALLPISLVLVPGLAIDVHGNRLGQGGGYYDRFLAQLGVEAPETPVLGYLFDEEVLPESSFESTVLDIPLGGAFTPSGLRVTL